jgi:4-amino-4-deoxy-L-arabinose transferase-like glycosyltransferase
MTRADRFAVFLSLLGVLAALLVADRVFERMAHIEDEMAYVWQAQAIARGHLTLPSPPEKESFLVPFVVDYNGQRFGKYPLGWPALLAVGVRLGIRSLINPLLAGLGIWLTYRLGKKIFSETVGLLAAGLTLTSPFFLMNSGSLLSHPFGLVLSAAFAMAWLDAFGLPGSANPSDPRLWLYTVTAGLTLGLLALTRPLTAVGVGLPFGLHGLYLLVRSDSRTRLRLIALGGIALALASLHFVWQYAVTGDPLLNPYTLWWDYDKVGFGPGVGRSEIGHTLHKAYINTRFSLRGGLRDLFGWGPFSWIFLPFGLLALVPLRSKREKLRNALLASSVFPAVVFVYLAYWIGSWLFGPRYYYEGLYSLTILSAAGIALLAGWPLTQDEAWPDYKGWRMARPLAMTAILAFLVAADVLFYIPIRVGGMHGLYGIERADLAPFTTQSAQELTPALVIVHPKKWTEYGALLELEDPFLDTPYIFIYASGAEIDQTVAADFPDRTVIHYYPDQPFVFYPRPRPDS